MRSLKPFTLIAVLLFIGGCSTTARLKSDEALRIPSSGTKQASEIEVYSTRKTSKPFQVLGSVVASCDAGEDAYEAVSKLRDEAAGLGADAIVGLRLEIDYGYWNSAIKATGTAVTFTRTEGERSQSR